MSIKEILVKRGETLALAESCTGGAIAARLTLEPGASGYFLGGFVVYSNEMKEKVLGVQGSTLEEKGAVSEEVVLEMLEGLFRATYCDWGVTVSGVAGPGGGTEEKPVGTVFVALGRRGERVEVLALQLKGSRQEIIEEASERALQALLEKVS